LEISESEGVSMHNRQQRPERGWNTVARLITMSLFAGLILGCGQQPDVEEKARPVFALKLADASEFAARSFPGRARAGQEVNRSFRVSGPLIELPVQVGQQVDEGEILARIDPQDFVTQLRTLEGQLERERANQQRAAADLSRIENVLREDPGATSQAAVDRARQLSASANAAVQSLEATVQSARDQLSYTNLTAPFAGVVVDTYVENFETVIARQPILRLLDPSSIEMVIQVPESLISLTPYVDSITVSFDAIAGAEIDAEIKEIGREATQATRTYPVTLLMAQPDDVEILPGMAGTAKIRSRMPEGTTQIGLEVPLTAIFSDASDDGTSVWVINPDTSRLERRAVTLGNLSELGVMILSGVEPGETIVTRGVNSLAQGDLVSIFAGAGD
jgi:RND family efflux transporter MFP subunit